MENPLQQTFNYNKVAVIAAIIGLLFPLIVILNEFVFSIGVSGMWILGSLLSLLLGGVIAIIFGVFSIRKGNKKILGLILGIVCIILLLTFILFGFLARTAFQEIQAL